MSLELRKRVADILVSSAAFQVNFSCASITVTPYTIGSVRTALLMSRIDAVIDPTLPDTRCEYRTKDDTIFLPDARFGLGLNNVRVERAAIFHECVHAIGDVAGYGNRIQVESEAAAYIAQMLFYQYETGQGWGGQSALYKEAERIANLIMNKSGAVVDLQDVMKLELAVVATPSYKRNGVTLITTINEDGVSGQPRFK